jgi:hypothetical protein
MTKPLINMKYKLSAFSFQVSAAKRVAAHFLKAESYQLKAPQRGFTVLLAAIVSSIVLMIGSSIFMIAQKQVMLSSIGRESQFAFYAADTGAECALYHDSRFESFGTAAVPLVANVTCDKAASGGDLTVQSTYTSNGIAATSTFSLDLFARDLNAGVPSNDTNCVVVTVAKNPAAPATVIHADGYSTSCAEITTSARSLQRSVELRY